MVISNCYCKTWLDLVNNYTFEIPRNKNPIGNVAVPIKRKSFILENFTQECLSASIVVQSYCYTLTSPCREIWQWKLNHVTQNYIRIIPYLSSVYFEKKIIRLTRVLKKTDHGCINKSPWKWRKIYISATYLSKAIIL